jgi:hypothetical protein
MEGVDELVGEDEERVNKQCQQVIFRELKGSFIGN